MVDNLDPLLARMKLDFEKWAHLGLSMWGRVREVQMVTLPLYNYVLGMLSLLAPLSLLRSVDPSIWSFVWGTSRPWLSSSKLRSCGGLSLPLVEHYALALHLAQLSCMLPGTTDLPQGC